LLDRARALYAAKGNRAAAAAVSLRLDERVRVVATVNSSHQEGT
jgi:hypothetical protein